MFPKSEEKEAPFLFPSSSHSLAHLHYSHHLVFWVFVCFILFFSVVSLSLCPGLCQKYWQLQYVWTESIYPLWLAYKVLSGPDFKSSYH